jgi:5'-deoxynucleotidase YfbR-like HD superfamily hydrolase
MNTQQTTGASTDRAWMRLPSGRHLDLINPDAQAWTDRDLAVRLARTYRWGGESRWPRPLSVAQHSLTVLAITAGRSARPLTPGEALRELLHDAEEGFLGFDCISPLKRALGQPFADVTARLMGAVNKRYALADWTAAEHAVHKLADRVAAATEAAHVVGWTAEEIRDVLQIDMAVLDTDPLAGLYGTAPWEPWPADLAAEIFLTAMHKNGAI